MLGVGSCRNFKSNQITYDKQHRIRPLYNYWNKWCMDIKCLHNHGCRNWPLRSGRNKGQGVPLFRCHNGASQKWDLVNGATFKNRANKKCLDFTIKGPPMGLSMQPCNQGTRQNFWYKLGVTISQGKKGKKLYVRDDYGKFKADRRTYQVEFKGNFIFMNMGDWYYIKGNGNYVHTYEKTKCRHDAMYLSVTPDGKKMNFWHKDDGSGRQRWKVKLREGGFNIMIVKGVSGGRKYLSST